MEMRTHAQIYIVNVRQRSIVVHNLRPLGALSRHPSKHLGHL